MTIKLKPVALPEFGLPLARPEIPAATYQARCAQAYAIAKVDWLFVYADREHIGNMVHLSGFEPRFEEAILLLGPRGRKVLITGNECRSYAAVAPLRDLEIVLSQSLSLLGQDRTKAPKLFNTLKDVGIASGDSIGVVGWKYLEPTEFDGELPGFFLPHVMVRLLEQLTGSREGVIEKTSVLMHPEHGCRATVDADQIAAFEWASTRASASVWRVLTTAKPGMAEIEAAGHFGYAGEPLACHTMFSSASAPQPVIGLASPTARRLNRGDGVTTAVGYWGGLSARAGLLTDGDDNFFKLAAAYFAGLTTWYDIADVGVAGGELFGAVADRLAQGGLASALNPGHLVNYDEWVHSPIQAGAEYKLRSGMPFQVDVIPTPLPDGAALNCEDTIVFADAELRFQIATKYPETWSRILARRTFMEREIGVPLKESILPLSNIPLHFPPFWLASDRVLVSG